jgi:hypothetical protein
MERLELGTSGGLDKASSAILSSNSLFIRSVPSKFGYSKNGYKYF